MFTLKTLKNFILILFILLRCDASATELQRSIDPENFTMNAAKELRCELGLLKKTDLRIIIENSKDAEAQESSDRPSRLHLMAALTRMSVSLSFQVIESISNHSFSFSLTGGSLCTDSSGISIFNQIHCCHLFKT